jgi:2-polyprenyl-3-methyl-5-hydroxy-6-metoxy-1,4-benzoquinol methylase
MSSIEGNRSAPERWPADGLENVPLCPVCGSGQRQLVHTGLRDRVIGCAPGEWTLHRCKECGSGFLDPRPTLATVALAYSSYWTHTRPGGVNYAEASWWRRFRIAQRNGYLSSHYGYDLKPAAWHPLFLSNSRRRRFDTFTGYLRFPGPGARVLDIGCGNGGFLWQMRSLGWKVCGVEPDPKSAAQAREAGLDVREGLLQQQAFPEAHFDAITMNHVIEHLHDPVDTLRHCWKILKPGGHITVITPNFGSRGHELYGPDWVALDPPRHLVLFTENSLRRAMESCGFAVARPASPSLKAREHFKQSVIIRRGGLVAQNPKLPLAAKWEVERRAAQADRATRTDPGRGEEVICLGEKPAKQR